MAIIVNQEKTYIKMNKVTGKITLAQSNLGIPNLLVVIYDVDPDTRAGEASLQLAIEGYTTTDSPLDVKESILKNRFPEGLGDRLGSVLTDSEGNFTLEYEDAEFQVRNKEEQRPDLLLVVYAPEKSGETKNTILFISPEIRKNAGRVETYFIQLTPKQPDVAGNLVTGNGLESNVKAAFESINQKRLFRNELSSQLVDEAKKRQHIIDDIIDTKIYKSFFNLNEIPKNEPVTRDDIHKYTNTSITKINSEIAGDSNTKGATIYVQVPDNKFKEIMALTNEQKQSEQIEKFIPGFEDIALEGSIYKKEFFLADKDKADLLMLLDGQQATASTGSGTTETTGENISYNSDDNNSIFAQVNRLMDPMESPEKLLSKINQDLQNLKNSQRPDQSTINESVRELKFNGGPADVPAFYDFNTLQIAFPHVWQELIDQEIIEVTDALLNQLIQSGVPIDDIKTATDVKSAIVKHTVIAKKAQSEIDDDDNTGETPRETADRERAESNANRENGKGAGSDRPNTKTPPNEPGLQDLDSRLRQLLNQKNKFTIFKEGFINYGILITYRQQWVPLNYQVGDLVRSIPLAPKEVRKINIKKVVKKDRAVKEMENNLRSRQNESTETNRTEKEIVDKANRNTSFDVSGSFSRWGITASSNFKTDASKSSDATKKNFREAVKKASQEFKDERKMEIETKESYESEYTESTEISNPNDELTVTYLFYELQRRFEVSEQLHRVTPVVLVPMPMPSPNVNELNDLVLKHGWIINRVLLDDRYRPALEYIMSGSKGEEESIKNMNLNLEAIRNNIKNLGSLVTKARNAVTNAANFYMEQQKDLDEAERRKYIEKNKFQVEMAKDVLTQSNEHEQRLMERLSAEQNNLLKATIELNHLKTQLETKKFEINMLRLHFKENIFYYMQAIWDYTHKDKLFMTLFDDKVPVITAKKKVYVVHGEAVDLPPSITPKAGHTIVEVEVKYEMESKQGNGFQTLIEIADLDSPLGYKGNYMIFPMQKPNAVTEFMMTPFLDEELGLRDPDGWGQWTPDEFVKFYHHLKQTKTAEEFALIEDALKSQYGQILSASRRLTEEIIVPSDSLYIEALPGKHPLLEDFKLYHRVLDVQKVQAEVRKIELENVRYASRILENQLEDPDTEKKVIVRDGVNVNINE